MDSKLVNTFSKKEKNAYIIISFILICISFFFLILSIINRNTNFHVLITFLVFFSMACLLQITYISFFLVKRKQICNKVILLFKENRYNDTLEYLRKTSTKKHFDNNRELILYFTGYSLLSLEREKEAITYFDAININKFNVFTAEIVSSTLLIKYLINLSGNTDNYIKNYDIYIANEKKLMKLTKNNNKNISLCFAYFSKNDFNNAIIILKKLKISNLPIFKQLISKLDGSSVSI